MEVVTAVDGGAYGAMAQSGSLTYQSAVSPR